MRYVILAAGLLAVTLAAPSQSSAQDRRSLQDSFNGCVEQARRAGWSEQDLSGNRDAARNYVIRCMQGRTPKPVKSAKR